MDISIAEAHNRLSALIKRLEEGPIMISRRGQTVGVLISPSEYDKLRRLAAFSELVEISRQVGEGPGADEIYRSSRSELEQRS